MIFKDYYKILDIDELTSDQEKIKEAYKKQAKKYHPDINKNTTNEIFNDIYESYKVLSNPNKKRAYDRLWLSYIAQDKKENKTYDHKRRTITIEEELKNLFFGEKLIQNIEKKKKENELKNGLKTYEKNITLDLHITIDEAFFGCKKEISFKNLNNLEKTIFITIPQGIKNGDKLRIKNFEKAAEFIEETNLLVTIFLDEPEDLKIKNLDLYKTVELYPWDLAFGKKISFKLFNENITVFVPKHSYKNLKFSLPQKGFKDKNGFRGNLFIFINIVLPQSFSDEDNELYKKMKENYDKLN